MKSTMTEHANGDKYWYLNGASHRIDGPAVECADGTKYWYRDGKFHRIDGPAVEWVGGNKWWCLDGRRLTLIEFVNHDLISEEAAQNALIKWV